MNRQHRGTTPWPCRLPASCLPASSPPCCLPEEQTVSMLREAPSPYSQAAWTLIAVPLSSAQLRAKRTTTRRTVYSYHQVALLHCSAHSAVCSGPSESASCGCGTPITKRLSNLRSPGLTADPSRTTPTVYCVERAFAASRPPAWHPSKLYPRPTACFPPQHPAILIMPQTIKRASVIERLTVALLQGLDASLRGRTIFFLRPDC